MREEKVIIYQYDELPEKIKQKVLQKLENINIEYDWYEDIYDLYTEELENIGFEDPEIHFTGFYNQGDGACFDAKLNIKKLINYFINQGKTQYKKLLKFNIFEYIEGNILKNNYATYYSHEKTRYTDVYLKAGKTYPRIENLVTELDADVEQLRNDYCCKIYNNLEIDYEYLTSREAIEETIRVNSYEFTEDGGIY